MWRVIRRVAVAVALQAVRQCVLLVGRGLVAVGVRMQGRGDKSEGAGLPLGLDCGLIQRALGDAAVVLPEVKDQWAQPACS